MNNAVRFQLLIMFILATACDAAPNLEGRRSPSSPAAYKMVGAVDTAFGNNGMIVTPDWWGSATAATGRKMLETSDGTRFELSQFHSGINRNELTKRDASGAIDTSFASSGRFQIPLENNAANEQFVFDTNLVQDRYIVFCGMEKVAGAFQLYVSMFDTSTGSMLNSFGGNGAVLLDTGDVAQVHDWALSCHHDTVANKIVGVFLKNGGRDRTGIYSFDMDGTPTAAFNGGSPLILTHASFPVSIYAETLVSTPLGYAIGGYAYDGGYTYNTGFVALVDRTGSLVNTFGTAGFKIFPTDTHLVGGLVATSDSLYVAMVDVNYTNTFVQKFDLATGTIVASFGTAGELNLTSALQAAQALTTSVGVNDIFLNVDGSLTTLSFAGAGAVESGILTNFSSSGVVSTTFGTNGSFVLPHQAGSTRSWLSTADVSPSGVMYVSGRCFTGAGVGQACHHRVK